MNEFKLPLELAQLLTSICDIQESACKTLLQSVEEVVGSADAAVKAQTACAEARKRIESLVDGTANWSEVCPLTSELVGFAIKAEMGQCDPDALSSELEAVAARDLPAHIDRMLLRRRELLQQKEQTLAKRIEEHCIRIYEREAKSAASISELESYNHVFAFTNNVLSFLDRSPGDQENTLPEQIIMSECSNNDTNLEEALRGEMPALLTACESAQRIFDLRMTAMGLDSLRLLPASAERASTSAVVAARKPSVEETSGLLDFANCRSILRGAQDTPSRVTLTGEMSPITQTSAALRSPQCASLSPLNVSVKERLKGRLTLDARKVFEEEKALAMLDDWGRSTPVAGGKRPLGVKLQLPDPVAPTGGGDYSFREHLNTARFGDSPQNTAAAVTKPTIPKRRMSLTAKALNSIAAMEPHLLLN